MAPSRLDCRHPFQIPGLVEFMNRVRSLVVPAGLGILSLLIAGCGQSDETWVDPVELYGLVQEQRSPVVLDVRSPQEYRMGHVPGALNIPYTELAAQLPRLEQMKQSEVVVYCEVGARARYADRLLRGAGFSQVRRLRGDMAGWRNNGLPVELR